MSERFTCGRRAAQGRFEGYPEDSWRHDDTCSYCGSMKAAKVFEAIAGGARVIPTDKSDKIYVQGAGYSNGKFYFPHFSNEDIDRFLELYNTKKILMGYPGHFYVPPFFAARMKR